MDYVLVDPIVGMADDSNYIACISLNNQPCMIRSTLIDLNPDEYNQGLCYYAFLINLDNGMEVLILLMIHSVEYVFQTKQKM